MYAGTATYGRNPRFLRSHLGCRTAANTLREAGVPASSISLQHDVLPESRRPRSPLPLACPPDHRRWNILGGFIGAAFGWLLAVTIGPEGTAGLVVQLVSWIIVGHLVAGMLAGDFVLADRTEREMPPDRPVSMLTVRDLEPRDFRRVRRLLRSHHPLDLR